jgi:hypothetical protein
LPWAGRACDVADDELADDTEAIQHCRPEHCLRTEAKGPFSDQGPAFMGILVLRGLPRKRIEEMPDFAFFKIRIPQGSPKEKLT